MTDSKPREAPETRPSLREYAARQWKRYLTAPRAQKGALLDEVVAVTGLHRKAVIRLLRRAPRAPTVRSRAGRPRVYGPAVARRSRSCGKGGPFGLDTFDYMSWHYEGGGLQLLNEFYQSVLKMNIVGFPIFPTTPQAFGWFKKPIKSVKDLKGSSSTRNCIGTKTLEVWDKIVEKESARDPFFKKVIESQKRYAGLIVPYRLSISPPYELSANHYWKASVYRR